VKRRADNFVPRRAGAKRLRLAANGVDRHIAPMEDRSHERDRQPPTARQQTISPPVDPPSGARATDPFDPLDDASCRRHIDPVVRLTKRVIAKRFERTTGEIGGPKGPEPTRYGDWEQNGRCSDF
jgi:hypothetical protein